MIGAVVAGLIIMRIRWLQVVEVDVYAILLNPLHFAMSVQIVVNGSG